MSTTPEELHAALTPIAEGLDFSIHDVEYARNLIRITVYRPGGISIDDLADANRAISAYLDENEPFEARYTLEVSSPGIERKLRTETHFNAAIGETVMIKTVGDIPEVPGRRVEGELIEATPDGIVIAPASSSLISLRYDQIDRARTVYAWAPISKPSPSRAGAPKGKKRIHATAPERIMTP
jgi:ribosome maturation factor RimP